MSQYDSDGTKWFKEQQEKIKEVEDSSLSAEEKQEKIKEMLTSADSWAESIWYLVKQEQPLETLEKKIAKELAALEKPVFTNDENQITDRTQTVVDNIDDSESGFKAWCEKTKDDINKRKFKNYYTGTKIGVTTEADNEVKYWYFDTEKNTFVENKPEP
jgi:hypothetical protein